MNIPILAREVAKVIFSTPRTTLPIDVSDFRTQHFPSLSQEELDEALLHLEAAGTIQLQKEQTENFAGMHVIIVAISGYR